VYHRWLAGLRRPGAGDGGTAGVGRSCRPRRPSAAVLEGALVSSPSDHGADTQILKKKPRLSSRRRPAPFLVRDGPDDLPLDDPEHVAMQSVTDAVLGASSRGLGARFPSSRPSMSDNRRFAGRGRADLVEELTASKPLPGGGRESWAYRREVCGDVRRWDRHLTRGGYRLPAALGGRTSHGVWRKALQGAAAAFREGPDRLVASWSTTAARHRRRGLSFLRLLVPTGSDHVRGSGTPSSRCQPTGPDGRGARDAV